MDVQASAELILFTGEAIPEPRDALKLPNTLGAEGGQ